MNFRIMVLLFLFGFLSAVLMAEIFLVSYEKQAMVQLSNDVKNQCQILGNQISSADFLHNPHNESLENDLAQVATLYDGRIILIDEDFNIVKDTYGAGRREDEWYRRKLSNVLRERLPDIMPADVLWS